MPTLTQLQYITTLDRLRHFGRAAKACHVSQPSLSMQIQKVEDLVGFAIFDRKKKPILPTERGQIFIEQAKLVLREHDKLVHFSAKASSEVSGNFELAVIPTMAPYLIPLFLGDFSKSFPMVNLRIHEMKTEEITRSLKDGTIDGAILATPLGEKSVVERFLFREPFFLYVSEDNALSRRKRIDEKDLDIDNMWLLQDGHCLRNQVVKICSRQGQGNVFSNIRFEGGNLETLRFLVQKSNGYTLIPYLFRHKLAVAEQVRMVREFESPVPSREVSLIYRRSEWKRDILEGLEAVILKNLPEELLKNTRRKFNTISVK